MKFTYNWLKDFLDLKMPPVELADRLTMAGLEVVGLTPAGNDFVFEVEITSNRPDWLSVCGIAREVAAITGKKIAHSVERRAYSPKLSAKALRIEVEDKKDCPLYNAKIIRNLKVGPSPDWLKERLELIGCRSINDIVDITNYIMFTWGQPLHAFDLDRLGSDTIVVRRARAGEKLVLIDGQQKDLNPGILVIAGKDRPVAIAGVMGGKDTEVTGDTKNILLEAAVFNPVLVRSGRRALGVQSESSYRFERGVDLENTEYASFMAAELIHRFSQGEYALSLSTPCPKSKPRNVGLDVLYLQRFLGTDRITAQKTKTILNSLGFKVKAKAKNNLLVGVPSFRPDVSLPADLIEEVARIFGYENIPTTLPPIVPQPELNREIELVSRIKNMLTGLGLYEAITHSLIPRDLLNGFSPENSGRLEILNPLSKEQEILRPTLLPSLLKCIAYNLNQKQGHISIFEVAKAFSGESSSPREELVLGIALCGARSLWLGQGHIQDEVGVLHLKGIAEVLLKGLGIKDKEYKFINSGSGIELQVNNVKVGSFIQVEKGVLDRLDIKNKEVFEAEINLEKLLPCARMEKKFTPFPRYPGVSRDVSLVLKEDISVERVMEVITASGGNLLEDVQVADYYQGKQIEPGFKGLTISCHYRSRERTLTEAEVIPLHTAIIQALKDKLQAKIR